MTASCTYDAIKEPRNPLYEWAWVSVLAPFTIVVWLTISISEERRRRLVTVTALFSLVPAAVLTAMGRMRGHEDNFRFWLNCVALGFLGIVAVATLIWRWCHSPRIAKPTPEP